MKQAQKMEAGKYREFHHSNTQRKKAVDYYRNLGYSIRGTISAL